MQIKEKSGGGGGGGGGRWLGDGCEPRIEVIVKMQKKKNKSGWRWGGRGGVGRRCGEG